MANNRWILMGIIGWLGCAPRAWSDGWNALTHDGSSYGIDVWDSDAGLPQNSVITLIQSRDGYLWLGTIFGLVRFDGMRFDVFDENNTPGLNSSRIVYLFEDRRGRIWVGTDGAGVVYLEGGRVISPAELSQTGSERNLAAVCEDEEGAVWLYMANGEVWRYWDGRFGLYLLPSLQASPTRVMIREPGGPVWVATDRRQYAVGDVAMEGALELPVSEQLGAVSLDYLVPRRAGGYWKLANGRVQQWRTNRMERDLGGYPWLGASMAAAIEDAQGHLVVGTRGAGLFWYDASGGVTSVSTNTGLSYNYILSLLSDHEGNLWVGTDGGGLNRIRRQVFNAMEASRGLVVQSTWPDRQGGLWIGANSGGIYHWREGLFHRYLDHLPVVSAFVDSTDRVWAGSRGLGLWLFEGERFQRLNPAAPMPAFVQAIYEDRAGRLWVGTQTGLARRAGDAWTVYTTAQGLSEDSITALAEDREGTLWIGTDGGGLNRFRGETFEALRKEDKGLPGDRVTSLCADAQGALWIGTSSGLARWHQGHWTRYTTQEGLVSNGIGYLLEDGQDQLWIGSNKGLMRVSKEALNQVARGEARSVPCRVYSVADGLPSSECTTGSQPGACRTEDGRLWFPTIRGLAWLDPARLQLNTRPPPVAIDAVYLEGQPQNTVGPAARPLAEILLPPGKQRLEIHYTGLNLGAPERARFSYRMAGLETAWTDAGSSRMVRFERLPPGEYRFEVIAANEDGLWNETGASLAVIVLPPFWRTGWFILLATFLGLGLTALTVHRVSTRPLRIQVALMKQQGIVEKERARIARDIHDQLGANLTQIALLGELVESDKASPPDVEDHARQISRTARDMTTTLDEIVWTVNPSNDSLEGLINYVCKYAQDYLTVAGVRCRLDVPSHLPDISIPPEVRHNVFLAAKEAVTNVVRHARASTARVHLTLAPDQFQLEIADDGRGLGGTDPDRASARNGLRNMRKRMEDIQGDCAFDPAPEGGLAVRFTVPISSR